MKLFFSEDRGTHAEFEARSGEPVPMTGDLVELPIATSGAIREGVLRVVIKRREFTYDENGAVTQVLFLCNQA